MPRRERVPADVLLDAELLECRRDVPPQNHVRRDRVCTVLLKGREQEVLLRTIEGSCTQPATPSLQGGQ
jgi:hypothetical protein